jgi:hypothetical protein
MLKYYSYYNIGGYKDMFLGDSNMKTDKTYFLPLLPIWKKKASAGDSDLAAKVKSLEALTSIKIVTRDESYGLPNSAKILFTHGGYKAMLTSSDSGEAIFAIRDIESPSKDESGRTIPFLLVIVGSSESDKIVLEKVAAYAAAHLDSFSKKVSNLFSYDSEKNGLAFDLSTFTSYLSKIAECSSNSLLTMQGEVLLETKKADVPLLILPEGINKSLAIQEQNLSGKRVKTVDLIDIIPLDNHDRLIAILKGRNSLTNNVSMFDKRVMYLLCGAAIIGFILGYFMAK